jgi:anti-sigma factor RsiW
VEQEPCRRERLWLSQRLDGTLTPFERLRLERHLARCPDCRGFERRLSDVTWALRTAPLELPARSVHLLRPRRSGLRLSAVFAAAACAIVVAGAAPPVPEIGGGRLLIVDDYAKDPPSPDVTNVWFPGRIA